MFTTAKIPLLLLVFFCHMAVNAQSILSNDHAVMMTSASDNTFICPDKKDAYLYVDLNAGNATKRIPLNICLVLDRSGSMREEERLHNAKIAICALIDELNPDDICSVVMYDHIAEVIHPAMPVSDKDHLKKVIHRIEPGGHTNIYMGLQLGYQEVKANFSPNRINRVILLSDGHPNEGITDDYLLEMVVKDHSQRDNISLSSFGMGHDFNEKLMHNMAEYGGGNYYFVERAPDAINDFNSEIKMLVGVVARSGMITIKYPNSNLKLNHFFGFPYTETPDGIKIDLKEIHPNEKNTMLAKFNFVPPYPDSIVFTTTLTYINTLTNQQVIKSDNVVVRNSSATQDCIAGFKQDVMNKIAFFNSNYYLDSAADHAERGDFETAHKTLASAKLFHKANASTDANLDQQYQLLNEYDTELESNRDAHPNKLKLLHKRVRHKNYKLRKNKCPVL